RSCRECRARLDGNTYDSAPGETGRASRDPSEPDYSAYLNSGMFFSSSLLALNTAWSGYHFDVVDAVVVVAAGLSVPVAAPVVVPAGLVPVFAVVEATGSLTNFSFS